jgi:hypothetical protein
LTLSTPDQSRLAAIPSLVSRGEKAARTEWAAVFLVAAELVRRGYVVSFTMGARMHTMTNGARGIQERQ